MATTTPEVPERTSNTLAAGGAGPLGNPGVIASGDGHDDLVLCRFAAGVTVLPEL